MIRWKSYASSEIATVGNKEPYYIIVKEAIFSLNFLTHTHIHKY